MNDAPTVYVVDDDPLMLAALRRVFTVAGLRVRTYASGRELLDDRASLRGHGALLLDVMMPGMSGLELQRELQARDVRLPVIFLTASGDVPMAVEAMRNGAVDFLEKPFDNAQLVARIRHAFALAEAPKPTTLPDTGYTRQKVTLTPREREVLDAMLTGKTSKAIGREFGVSHRTVEIHRAHVMEKMGAKTLAELVRMSIEADRER